MKPHLPVLVVTDPNRGQSLVKLLSHVKLRVHHVMPLLVDVPPFGGVVVTASYSRQPIVKLVHLKKIATGGAKLWVDYKSALLVDGAPLACVFVANSNLGSGLCQGVK
jgi:hypothetical protein